MISIKKLFHERADKEAVLKRAVTLFLQLIDVHAVQADDIDYAQFRSCIRGIADRFDDTTKPDEILILVGEVATALKEYSERTTRYIRAQAAEYQQIADMLTETIAETTRASDRTVERLVGIEKKLEKASVLEDVKLLRMQIGDCLESIREEIQAQSDDSAAAGEKVEALVEKAGIPAPAIAETQETDPVTGLPGRWPAEAALSAAAEFPRCYYAVAIVANRVGSINTRFGYAVGDRVLQRVADQLRAGLSADDRVFRWSGPAFIAVLLRTVPEAEVNKEIARIISVRIEDLIEVGNRFVLLPISATWAIFPVNSPVRILRQKVDEFIQLHALESS